MRGKTAHVLIGRACASNCVFCAVAAKRKARAFPTKSEVLGFIRDIAADGTDHLVFSGLGEPTLDSHFEEYLDAAKEAGFDRICLFTNGFKLTVEKAKRWKRKGLTEVLLSLHGMEHDHDHNVRRKGSFREAVFALDVYTSLGLSVTVNTCLTRINLHNIGRLRTLVSQYPIKMHTLSNPEWTGNAQVLNEYLPDYEEIAAVAEELIPEDDALTYFDNIPYCLVKKKTREMLGMSSVRLLDGKNDVELDPVQAKVFPDSCAKRQCLYRHYCPGFERNYIASRGWQNLIRRIDQFLDNIKDDSVEERFLTHCRTQPRSGTSRLAAGRNHYSNQTGHLLAVIKPTYRCNAACSYCCSHRSRATADLGPELLSRLYDEAFEYAHQSDIGRITFLWHGGEPLLLGKAFYADALETSRRRKDFRIDHRIQTNLLVLDKEWIRLFKTHGVRLGTSVDPIGKERIFKNGQLQYPYWLDKFRLVCEENLPVGIVFTVTSDHIHQADAIYHFFRNLQTLSRKPVPVRINPVSPVGMASTTLDAEQIVKPAAFGDFLYRLWELWNEDGRPFLLSPLNEWLEQRGVSCEFSGSCHDFIFSIDASGDVHHCGRFADSGIPLGNIFQEKLQDILKNPQRLQFRQRATVLQERHCKGCRSWNHCKGGCPYHAYIQRGDGLHASPFCQGLKRFFERSGLEKKEASPLAHAND